MSGSVNKVILVGNVGNQPEIRISQTGGNEIANFSIATSERWKDKNSGEQKEKTDCPGHRGLPDCRYNNGNTDGCRLGAGCL